MVKRGELEKPVAVIVSSYGSKTDET